jgi:antitoxin (DNA-binding transcriptional repressor) of toxin-antitoxin stability system
MEVNMTGEEVIIAKHGKPIAKLTALRGPDHPRVPGKNKGKGAVKENFDDPLPEEILKGFLG